MATNVRSARERPSDRGAITIGAAITVLIALYISLLAADPPPVWTVVGGAVVFLAIGAALVPWHGGPHTGPRWLGAIVLLIAPIVVLASLASHITYATRIAVDPSLVPTGLESSPADGEPLVYSGRGDAEFPIHVPGSGGFPLLLDVHLERRDWPLPPGTDGDPSFTVELLDTRGEAVGGDRWNSIGRDTHFIDVDDADDVTTIRLLGDRAWTVTVVDVDGLATIDGPTSGAGTTFSRYTGPPGTATIDTTGGWCTVWQPNADPARVGASPCSAFEVAIGAGPTLIEFGGDSWTFSVVPT